VEISVQEFASAKRWRERIVPEMPHMAVENHLWALQVYCEWAKKNPGELMLERQTERFLKQKGMSTVSFKRIAAYQLKDRSKTKHTKAFIGKALTSFYENDRAGIIDRSMTHEG
jgi:hypothetical protein